MYLYPENLKAKAILWLWPLKSVFIISVSLILSVSLVVKLGNVFLLALTLAYAILTVQIDNISLLYFIKQAANYFFADQQFYEWRARGY